MMFDPPHPGELVLDECIKPMGITITDAATALGVTRKTLSGLVNGKSGISADMAIHLALVFGGSAELWVRMQANYDLWQAQKRMKKWKPKTRFTNTNPVINS